ncbi:isoleucine--tRNA ligase [Tundrisphaera lichenicola]|uniref:isoleucine--tRNA ligase n=1 Tax=Tundrisphaera lichenicola TaxID=2029860 RepID=UPI003EC13676
MSTNAKPYKETLNLPATAFDMKANLTVREPKLQARWKELDLYGAIRAKGVGKPAHVLHDGPPYANGEIHMGHLLNKVLKDVVVRSQTMLGYDSPYVPGWDCHGLPIEHKVMKDLGSKAAGMGVAEVRALCHAEAMKWVDIQRNQFLRLGISGDWDNPYLTLDPRYEAGIMDVLAGLLDAGSIFRQLKPIHWCLNDRTALAEAELEYSDETSTSIYVNFPMVSGVPESWGEGPWHAMIWTTTPWTLPANVAIAAHPELTYVGLLYDDPTTGQPIRTILAAELAAKVMAFRGVTSFEELGRCKGKELENARYRHVFIDRESPIVLAQYVTVEDGTGLVHTAPGHGTEDYQTGQAYGLPTLSPVDGSGLYTDEAPPSLVGEHVFKANPKVVAMVRDAGYLYHEFSFAHSYPHCWRCKKPVIFRATEQWFVAVDHDDLRENTLKAINNDVKWHPAWGRTRIEAMVSTRPDWCISRQRAWGVPIPALGCVSCETQVLTAETARHFRDLFRAEGADAWFSRPADEIKPPGLSCPKCGGTSFRKEGDILDVWFESGCSHHSVLQEPSFGLTFPAFLYLEGSDQHRGWFQSNILLSMATNHRPPFENVLTHGFIVDEQGKKMAKSGGNAVSAVKATEQYGADVLRLYVASLDYADDVRMSERGIKETSEAYRKIRNTFRYLLGNLEDYAKFDPSTVDPGTLHEIDRWALGQLNALIRDVTESYQRFEFYKVYQRIYQFCSVDLSSFYLDVLKDRLYAEAPDGPDRKAAQFVLSRLHEDLARLLAPILPHTAEEIWDVLPADRRGPSVHLAEFPRPDPRWDAPEEAERWDHLKKLRDLALVALEGMRKQKLIGSGQEAKLRIGTDQEGAARLDRKLLETLCMVSEVHVEADRQGPVPPGSESITAEKSTYGKCERCWNYRAGVGQDAEHPTLCDRCSRVVASMSL